MLIQTLFYTIRGSRDESPIASGSKDKSSPIKRSRSPVRRSRSPVKRSPDRKSPSRRSRTPDRPGRGIGKPITRGIGSRSPVERRKRSPLTKTSSKVNPTHTMYRTRPCEFFKKGKCLRGDDCNYKH